MRVAAIDLGSNSFHMVIAEVLGPASFEVVLQEKMMIQLGRMALVQGRLDPEAMERGLRCLEEFRRLALARRTERILTAATSAIREAANGDEFLSRARQETGLPLRVISGKEEARLIHLAVSRHVELGAEKALLVDIGGGSVELTVADGSRIYYSTSLKLGFLRLHGRLVTHDPMTRAEARRVDDHVREALAFHAAKIVRLGPTRAVATSGSATTLLRLAESKRGSTGPAGSPGNVTREELREILEALEKLPSGERARRFDLDPLRSTYLPTALRVFDAALERCKMEQMTVCSVALREGLLYDFASRVHTAALPASQGDLRLEAVLDLATRCDYSAEHSHQVGRLAVDIFRQTAKLHELGPAEEQLLYYAALLHDVGYHIGYAKHHKHGYYLVMNCDLRGFEPNERQVLANLVRYHRRAAPKRKHDPFDALDGRSRDIVRRLAAILRIADGLDASHFSQVQSVRCTVGRKKVWFELVIDPSNADLELDLWAARRHARYFEKLFDIRTKFSAHRARRKIARPRETRPATPIGSALA